MEENVCPGCGSVQYDADGFCIYCQSHSQHDEVPASEILLTMVFFGVMTPVVIFGIFVAINVVLFFIEGGF